MKFNFIYTFFFLSIAFCLFTSSEDGRATNGQGNTGAPGDQLTMGGQPWVCQTCHSSTAIQVTQSFELTDMDGNDVFATGYTPGETYNAKLTVTTASGTPEAYGFQILALNAADGVSGPEVSNWTAVSGNVSVQVASATGRTYVEHNNPSASNEFTMTWVAPADGSGDVTFYAVSNGVNLDGEAGGDGATGGTFALTENTTSSLKDLTLAVDMTIFPNPAERHLSVAVNIEEGGSYDWSVTDLLGRTLQAGQFNLPQGESQQSIGLVDMASGLYQFQLRKDGKVSSAYLVKK